MKTLVIIPFRLESQRFPGKALASFAGEPLVVRALGIAESVRRIVGEDTDVIITGPEEDYQRIHHVLDTSGLYRYVPTGSDCRSATDRVMEISRKEPADLYVSIPLDEVLLRSDEVARIINDFDELRRPFGTADALTLWCPFYCREDAISPLSAKIVADTEGRVLYMSRAPVPMGKDGTWNHRKLKKHVGVYFSPRLFLDRLYEKKDTSTILDKDEGLEQLRWLELGLTLQTVEVKHIGFGVDIPEQIAELEARGGC